VLYVLVAAASLPGATVLTLAGAALFGFWTTLVLVSFASTIGATAACALCRTLLREAAQRRLGPASCRHRRRHAPGRRLLPFLPAPDPNLSLFRGQRGHGPDRPPLATFAVVSQIGMLPATAVYINAGLELGRLDSLAGIVSPGLLLAFVLLGLLPLAARRAIALWRSRRTAASRNASGGNT